MRIPVNFHAFRIRNDAASVCCSSIETLSLDAFAPGEVVIRTTYSSPQRLAAVAQPNRSSTSTSSGASGASSRYSARPPSSANSSDAACRNSRLRPA